MDEERMKLKRICDEAVLRPELESTKNPDGSWTTHCNAGLYWIYNQMNWFDILPRSAGGAPLLANDLVDALLKDGPNWKRGTGADAHHHANNARPTVIGKKYAGHGHIVKTYPATAMGFSGSLNKEVPMVTNVGAHPKRPEDEGKNMNSICRMSEAFLLKEADGQVIEPFYFLYVGARV